MDFEESMQQYFSRSSTLKFSEIGNKCINIMYFPILELLTFRVHYEDSFSYALILYLLIEWYLRVTSEDMNSLFVGSDLVQYIVFSSRNYACQSSSMVQLTQEKIKSSIYHQIDPFFHHMGNKTNKLIKNDKH